MATKKTNSYLMTTDDLDLIGFISSIHGRQPDSYKHGKSLYAEWDADADEGEDPVSLTFGADGPYVLIGVGSDELTYPVAGYCAVHKILFDLV